MDPCSCPLEFSRCAGRCLRVLDDPMPYPDAEKACEDLGAHLAVPCSEAENQCARDMTEDEMDIWLGVTDRDMEGSFAGVPGTCSPAPLSRNWWASTEPSGLGENEDCAAFLGLYASTGWYDDSCDTAHFPLCQLRNCDRLSQCGRNSGGFPRP